MPDTTRPEPDGPFAPPSRPGDGLGVLLGVVAAGQAGVVDRGQCRALAVSDDVIQARVRGGRWQRLFTGVFATFSGPVPRLTLLWAAVRYAGPDAVLSHESAAELTGLLDRPAARVHVTVPATRRIRPVPGLVVHRSRRVAEARHPTRLPAQTRIEETVIDLTQQARHLDPALSWLATACGRRLTTAGRLAETVRRRRRLRWRRELLAALDDVADGCHSLLELRYLRDVERRHRLPAGRRQATRPRGGGRWYDDVRYPGYATLVELDGRAAHPEESGRRDRLRDNAAALDGFAVLRYGPPEILDRPCETARQVASALRRHGWTGRPVPCRAGCPAGDVT